MPETNFIYETCLMKHHVRVNGWLPFCRRRLQSIRAIAPRRLRYFTFCAVGAIDVLMLDVANIIRRSNTDRFDTVVFFDQTPNDVLETKKRIPGAIGFPGDFTTIVLLEDPDEATVVDNIDTSSAPVEEENTIGVRRRESLILQRQSFINQFPFDVINLDLEEHLFKPNDELPGRVVNSLKKLLEWQRRSFITPESAAPKLLDGFTLMFTTRIGPENLSEEYLQMLEDYLESNLAARSELHPIFASRTNNVESVRALRVTNFDLFFKLATPKVIASILLSEDWYVDPAAGVVVYEFERHPEGYEPYKMLHMVMDVKRQIPARNRRPPRVLVTPAAEAAYASVVREIIEREEIVVTEEGIDRDELQENLDIVFLRRKKYYPTD
jgi:hypothetical protein